MDIDPRRRLPPLTDVQLQVIERVYEFFKIGDSWPTFGDLDREFHRTGVDLLDVLKTIPMAYVRVDRSQINYLPKSAELNLCIFGIAMCKDSQDDLNLFFEALRWLGDLESGECSEFGSATPHSNSASAEQFALCLTSTDLWESLEVRVRKVGMLLQNEPPGIWESFGGSIDAWSLSPTREIRKYAKITSFEEYLFAISENAPSNFGLPFQSIQESSVKSTITRQDARGLTQGEIMQVVNQYIGVSGGYLGDFSYRTHAEFYSEYCELDIDPSSMTGTTRERFIAILSSLSPTDQAKVLRGVILRFPLEEGQDSRKSAYVKILKILDRLELDSFVIGITPQIANSVVIRALEDAENLIRTSGAISAVDRVHTSLHGYLQAVCDSEKIDYNRDDSMVAIFKKLRMGHAGFRDKGPRSQDVEKVLNSCANILDAFLPVRNQASVAHPNQALIGEPEARLVINVGRTLLTYLDAKFT